MLKKGVKKQKARQQVTSMIDVLAPSVISFQPKDIVLGNQNQSVMVITDFAPEVGVGWLSDIVTMPGVIASIHTNPTDSYDLIQTLNTAMGVYQGRLNSGGNAIQIQRAEKGYKDAEKLLKKIDQEQQQVAFVTVVLLITANDSDTLHQRIKRVESRLAGQGMRGRIPTFRQEQGLKMVAPWGIESTEIMQMGARNMTMETVAASFPFVYSGLNDGDGILLGNDQTGGIVLVDFWVRKADRTNSNLTIMGRPGVGKSATVKKILLDEYKKGTKIIIIDPEREYKEMCENLEGNWIDCGGGAKGRINPLEVRIVPIDDEEEEVKLYSDEIVKKGPLAIHFQTLRTFFKLYMKDITRIHMAMLEMALEELYIKEFNISWDVDPQKMKPSDWPTLKDLYELLEKKKEENKDEPEWRELSLLLRSAAIGADSVLWSGETTIEADKDIVVLDIHQLLEGDEEIRKAQFFNILSWAWTQVAKDREQKKLLAVDEAYLLVDPETPQPLAFLRNTSKRIRKYEGGLMVITHNLVDFLDPAVRRYGQALIDNPVYKIIMGQGDKDIEALTKLMTLSEREIQTLMKGERGAALFIAGNRRLQINIELFQHEIEMMGAAGGR